MQLKADHSLTVKAREYRETYRSKRKKSLDKSGNKRSGMVLYVLQAAFYRKLQMECKNKGDSSNNRLYWDHFKVI
jgi:hypothetical protein